MQNSFTFRQSEEIDQREAGLYILQKYWKTFAPRDICQWEQRIRNSRGHIVAAYVGNVIAGVLEAMRLDIGGNPFSVPTTFEELTAHGTWASHNESGDTVMLVDLTIAPQYQGIGLFEGFVRFATKQFESPSGVILTYSPLFGGDKRYGVVGKHQHLGATMTRELIRSRPGLVMTVAEEESTAEDVGIMSYSLSEIRFSTHIEHIDLPKVHTAKIPETL
jgi:hypothetical protein